MPSEKVKKWAEYILIGGAGLFFAVMAIILFTLVANKEMAKDWDALSFIGSLLGGGATLYAVLLAINKQQTIERMKNAPALLRKLDKFDSVLYVIDRIDIESNVIDPLWIDKLDDLRLNREEILDLAIEIHPDLYQITRNLFAHIIVVLLCFKNDQKHQTKMSSRTKERVTKLKELKVRLNEVLKISYHEFDD